MWEYGSRDDENVLKGLRPHPNLKMLEIEGFGGESFPPWSLKMDVYHEGCWVRLSNLMDIRLDNCSNCEEIPTLGQLPRLKSLFLYSMDKVKFIGASFYGIEECNFNNGVYKKTASVFPALKKLELGSMDNLIEWEGVEIPSGAQVEVFPCLEHLVIYRCRQLRSAPSQLTSLKELEIGYMDSGLSLASICGRELKTLTKLKIDRIRELTCLPDWLFHNNQHLLTLEIEYCFKLSELPNGMHSLNSLEKLSLTSLRSLSMSPIGGGKLQSLTSLCSLSISGCQWVRNVIGEMKEPFAPLLNELYIDALGLDEYDCASLNKTVYGILGLGCTSLRKLNLIGKDNWECLPDQLQHLTALEHITLSHFGIEELPEWFGNFSSLKKLTLANCRKLKHLPSMEAMRRLKNLASLRIIKCRLLIERCNKTKKNGDSEWPKISHIPEVQGY